MVTADITVAAGGFADSPGIIPDRSTVMAITMRVVTTCPGPTSIQLGVPGSPDRYGNGMSPQAGSTVNGISGTPVGYYGATPVRVTAVGGSFTGGGLVRVAASLLIATVPAAS